MANWKKVIVSGSDAILNTVTASFQGDGSGLTGVAATSLDIDNFGSDLTSTTLAASDLIIVSDGGTDGRANIGDLSTPLAGTGLEADSDTIRIAAAAAGDGLTGGAGSALAVNTGTGLEIDSDAVRIAAAAAGNGLTGGGGSALAVNTGAGLEINSDAVRIAAAAAGNGLTGGAGSALAVGAGTHITVNANDVAVNTTTLLPSISGSVLTTVSGDVVITADGVATIQADSVALGTDTTGNYVATLANATNGGTSISNGSAEGGAATVAVDLNDLAEETVAVATDFIAFIDADDNASKKESIEHFVDAMNGTGLGASGGQLSVTYGSSAGTAAQGNTSVTFAGASGEITMDTNTFTSIGGGGSVTIGLADTISGNRTFSNDVTISGNLTVSGDYVTANVTNLAVDDQFILINSGSASGDCGIIFGGAETGTANEGAALFFDDATDVFGLASAIGGEATGATLVSKLGNIEAAAANPSSAPTFQGVGTIHIDTSAGVNGVCDNNIWIYS